MTICFATGSALTAEGRGTLRVLNYIEYLTYDFENERVHLMGDFIVENVSNERSYLYGLHRGNIPFELATDEWLNDDYWTKVMLELAGAEIGLIVDVPGNVSLVEAKGKTLRVKLLPDTPNIEEWGPPRPKEDCYTYFTMWKSPPINPDECVLFRIKGTIAGETYRQLLSVPTGKIKINGGLPLQKDIEDDFEKRDLENRIAYEQVYRSFKENQLRPPEYYLVFFEGARGEEFQIDDLSTDMRNGCSNRRINGRLVNWYWSDCDFNLHAGSKGPALVLARM